MKEQQGQDQGAVAARTLAASLYLGRGLTSSRGALLLTWFVKPLSSASRQSCALIKVYGPALVNLGTKK